MRVTFILPSARLYGGTQVVAIYAQHLLAQGHEVNLVAPRMRLPGLVERARRRWRGDPVVPERGKEAEGLAQWKSLGLQVRLVEDGDSVTADDVPDADVVVATWWRTSFWVMEYPASKGVKAYFMQDYGAPGQEIADLVPTWRLPMHMITIAPWLVRLVEEHVGERQIDLVWNGVKMSDFDAGPRTKSATPRIGYVHSSMASKGCDLLPEVVRIARDRLGGKLDVVTFGRSEVSDAHRPEGLQMLGSIPPQEVAKVYRSCDAWVFPSRREGFGLPILEALAAGTPVAATPAGAAPDLLADGGGVLCDRFDSESLAEAVVKICSMSNEAWAECSEQARRIARERTWENASQAFEDSLRRATTGEFANAELAEEAA